MQKHVFISYVRNDQKMVNRICSELNKAGIRVWLDRNDIDPGKRWKTAIRNAIKNGAFFIACFSESYLKRESTYMNEELVLAIEELRKRREDQTWFIPLRLTNSKIPDRSIGAGETLRDLQWIDIWKDWSQGISQLLKAVSPKKFELDRLIITLRKGSDIERAKAAEALAIRSLDYAPALKALLTALSDPAEIVRNLAKTSLETIGDNATIVLIRAFREKEHVKKETVLQILKHPNIVKTACSYLLSMLDSSNEAIRIDAMTILQYVHCDVMLPDIVKKLVRCILRIESRDETIKLYSTIPTFGEKAVPFLIDYISDTSADVLERAFALENVLRFDNYRREIAAVLIKTVRERGKGRFWFVAEMALIKLGDKITQELISAIKLATGEEREELLRLLKTIAGENSTKLMKEAGIMES